MHSLKLFTFFLFVIMACNKPTELEEREPTCRDWQMEAEWDIMNSDMLLIDYGDRDYLEKFKSKIQEKYGIRIKQSFGCVITSPVECYNDLMYEYIESRLGQDIWTKMELEARALFKKENGYEAYGPITPDLVFDSCVQCPPNILYQHSSEKYPFPMEKTGLLSLAGEDLFCELYSNVLLDSIESMEQDYDSKINLMKHNFEQVNEVFRCMAEGGTHYGHMSNRIDAYLYFYLWQGIKNDFECNGMSIDRIQNLLKKSTVDSPDIWSSNLYSPCVNEMEINLTDPWVADITFQFLKVYINE